MMKISAAKEKKKQYAGDEEDEMSISDVSNVFGFLGGLGMFLYGMNILWPTECRRQPAVR